MNTEITPDSLKTMKLYEIAKVIRNDWKTVHFTAKPYLEAMGTLTELRDNYGFENGLSIVRYFLSNTSSWRGDVAKMVKKELNRRIR